MIGIFTSISREGTAHFKPGVSSLGALAGKIAFWSLGAIFSFAVAMPLASAREFLIADAYGTTNPASDAVERFSRAVAKRTQGRLTFGYESKEGHSESFILAQLRQGQLDFAHISLLALNSSVPSTVMTSISSLFESSAQGGRTADGSLGVDVTRELESIGLIALCFYESGQGVLYSTQGPIRRPSDLEGVRVAVRQGRAWAGFVKSMGATPVAVPQRYEAEALRVGVIDAADGTLSSMVASDAHRFARHVTLMPGKPAPSVLLVNKRDFDELSTEDQKLLREIAADSILNHRNKLQERDAVALQAALKAGAQIVKSDDANGREGFKAAAASYRALVGF